MHDLSFPVVAPEEVLSDRFRVHAVNGDAMEPTLRGGRDYALLAPVAAYQGEGSAAALTYSASATPSTGKGDCYCLRKSVAARTGSAGSNSKRWWSG